MAIHSAHKWVFDRSTLWKDAHLPCHILREDVDSLEISVIVPWLHKHAGNINIDWKYVSIFDVVSETETLHIAVRDTEIVLLFNLSF